MIVTARDAFTLLLGWETLTVAFYLLAGASPRDPDRAGPAQATAALVLLLAGCSIPSPSWLWVELPAMLALVVTVTFALSGWRPLRVRRVPAWRSATIGVEGPASYTACTCSTC